MLWTEDSLIKSKFSYTGSNQHGNRYKVCSSKRFSVVKLSCKTKDSTDITKLVLLSHTLNVPVHYDFGDGTAYIEVVSAEELRKL